MSPPALASVVFGIYALGMGVGLVAAPGLLLPLFSLPVTTEPWVRIVGGTALALGLYYVQAGRHELVPFFQASIFGRLAFAAVSTGCAVAWDLPAFFLFAAVDGGSAVATAVLLKRARPA